MLNTINIFLSCILISYVSPLHLQETSETEQAAGQQIKLLTQQQSQFTNKLDGIKSYIQNIDNRLKGTDDTNAKINILENAIKFEKNTIYESSKVFIPNFNISKELCARMTDDQKVSLLENLASARIQLNGLKNLTTSIPQSLKKDAILSDIQKQEFFIDSIESIIYTNCTKGLILSSTVFQTNIYAKGWILGDLTIQDLIQVYYRRSQDYNNITNCPVQFPFLGNDNKCIECKGDTPIFNISSRLCVSCKTDQHIDNDKKQCVNNVHFTNWTNLTNYDTGNQPLPTPQAGSTSCPSSKPYYTGKQCIECVLPKYFYVPQLKCKQCGIGNAFDQNTKNCVTLMKNQLTRLSGTKWVSNQTIMQVLTKRGKVLQDNKTLGTYRYCPVDKPYYDGVTCLSCVNQFSLNQSKCVSAPQGKAYDPNLHTYFTPESNKETNPDAKNVVGKPQNDHPDIQNCNQTNPYYDGVACINCSAPFPLFNSQSKRCVVCDASKVYNASAMECQQRSIIYISQNSQRLMATPRMRIQDYESQIDQATNQSQAIVVNCPNATQYSNFTDCISCNSTEYFNVEYKVCDTCQDGKINATTRICTAKIHHVSNLSAQNIINFRTNRSDEQIKLAYIMKQYPNVIQCTGETPFFNGSKCIQCYPPLYFFDFQDKRCVGCPNGSFYLNNGCAWIPVVSNLTALSHYPILETPPHGTLIAMAQRIEGFKNNSIPYKQCPQTFAFFNLSAGKCSRCPRGQMISLGNGSCMTIAIFSNVTALQKLLIIQRAPNATLEAINNSLSIVKSNNQPYYVCPEKHPYYNKTETRCTNCSQGQIIDLVNGKCQKQVTLSNAPALRNISVIETPPYATIDKIQQTVTNYTNKSLPFKICPQETPLYNHTTSSCSNCDSGFAIDLATRTCVPCQYYDNITKKCYILPTFSNIAALNATDYIQTSNSTLQNLTNQIQNYTNITGHPYKMCAAETPYFNSSTQQCTNCSNGTYLSLETRSCVLCQNYSPEQKLCLPPIPYYANLSNYNWTVNNSTIQDIYNWTNTLKDVPKAQECPAGREFYNNNTKRCQSCPKNNYFNYDTYVCTDCSPQVFDINVHQCLDQLPTNTSQTSPNASNLTYGGIPSNQYLDEYNAKKAANPNITDCPLIEKPYFDGINCIMCPPIAPYFSIKTSRCHTCPTNSTYNAQRQQCVSNEGSTVTNYPNPAKMYASIFHQAAITRPES